MSKLELNVKGESMLASSHAYLEKARGLVYINQAHVSCAGFSEEITGIDASLQTYGCILPWAFFYPQKLDAQHLRRSLAVILNLHPAVAGRIRLVSRQERDNDKYRRCFRIEHNNAGVEFIEAVGNFKQAVINQPILRQQKILIFQDRLPPYFEGINWMRMLKGKEPLMKVKLTHTIDGASILAVSFAHVIVDGTSFMRFMQDWTEEYKNIKQSSVTDRSFHNRLVLQPSTIEASFLALQRNETSIKSTNPFLSAKQFAAFNSHIAEEVSVSSAVRNMQSEDIETIPGCVLSNVPDVNVFTAFRKVMQMVLAFRQERRDFPKLWSEMTTEVFYLPSKQLASLKSKALAACSQGEYVSANDVVAALMWTTVCDLRSRPLPGESDDEVEEASRFCMALDLRRNGLDHCVPKTYFGNASWVINISGRRTKRPHEHNPFLKLIHEEHADRYGEAFMSAARRIRRCLTQFREDKSVSLQTMRTLLTKTASHWSSRVIMLADHMMKCDAFLTSWQFPIWDIDFGCGAPKAFHGFLHNAPPYSCVVIPCQQESEGVYVSLTIPCSSSERLRKSWVLKQLAPEGRFMV